MSNHLQVKIDGEYINTYEDFSVDFEDVNPLFNDYESYSLDVEIPVESNRHKLKTIDNVHNTQKLVEYEHLPMQIIVDGVPFRSGLLRVGESEVIDDSINVSMVSTFLAIKDMVSDLTCRDIPIKDKIKIGEMIGDVFVDFKYNYSLVWKSGGKTGFLSWSSTKDEGMGASEQLTHTFQLQALGFSLPAECEVVSGSSIEEAKNENGKPIITKSFINVADEYPTKQYCNSRVCYMHYQEEEDGSSGKTMSTKEEFDPYYILEADRPQSGICFYVLYFLDCLFHYLGFAYNKSPLLTIGDMKRLAFFTTHCKYDLQRKYNKAGYDLNNETEINKWLSSRATNGEVKVEYEPVKKLESLVVDGKLYKVGDELPNGEDLKDVKFEVKDTSYTVQANIMEMFANSQNLPDVSVSSVLDSLWASFGIRFITDYEKRTVEPVYIREVFRDTSSPIPFHCELLSVRKISEKITGVRMKYAAESDAKEQEEYIRSGKKDYDTNYDYKDYSNVDAARDYLYIIRQNSKSDTTCYVDIETGNAYRIKVDKDATRVDLLKPAVFEVGGYKGVEIGDCSSINEDFVIELVSDFEPLIMNDVNGRKERLLGDAQSSTVYEEDGTTHEISSGNIENMKQIMAAYVDETMWHENMKYTIQNTMSSNFADVYLTETCTTDESYDPAETEDGNSPLQHVDWGCAISVMRGGGSTARIQLYDYNYDGNGNSKWRWVAGEYAMNPDTIDNWGNDFDYNGTTEGIGDDERFSLKIRAYKEVDGQTLCQEDEVDENGHITRKVKSRGLHETFMSEYTYFLLNRQPLEFRFRCEVAQLTGIQWKRRYQIDDYIFLWNKLRYSIDSTSGLGVVTAEVYMI